ncbi:regulator of chromosome condensation-like [Drosophila obscura]|uniref:regulator of chromosome condensation-like n=1 Tax=Drosophila obscura TaxID=7282 RepID=UPI001BB20D32|nr:regulator of chromosome condensation-like [Drosophila obscura]
MPTCPTQVKIKPIAFHLELPKRRVTVGRVLVCGMGYTGQLGLGSPVLLLNRLSLVSRVPNPVDVCAGGLHSLVLTKSGDVYSFGSNEEGALGRSSSSQDCRESMPALVKLPGKALCISAGDSHSACILEDGSVYVWGSFFHSHGNMGMTNDDNNTTPTNLLAGTVCCSIASGSDHLVILTTSGKVFTLGCAEYGQLGRISERSLSGDGRRGKQDLLRPAQIFIKNAKPFEAIWATNHGTFLREFQTGTIWAMGLNDSKQLAHGNELEPDHYIYPVKTTLQNIKQIAGGSDHTLLLQNNLQCFAVGSPECGRLGLGDIKDVVPKLTRVKKLSDNIVYVGCGTCCSYAIAEDGKLYSWGLGSNNQLGVGEGEDELEPVLVSSKHMHKRKMLLASGGEKHSIFLVEADAKN